MLLRVELPRRRNRPAAGQFRRRWARAAGGNGAGPCRRGPVTSDSDGGGPALTAGKCRLRRARDGGGPVESPPDRSALSGSAQLSVNDKLRFASSQISQICVLGSAETWLDVQGLVRVSRYLSTRLMIIQGSLSPSQSQIIIALILCFQRSVSCILELACSWSHIPRASAIQRIREPVSGPKCEKKSRHIKMKNT